MVILEIEGRLVPFGALSDQIYSLQDDEGWQYHWNVTQGMRLAEASGSFTLFVPSDHGITLEEIRTTYVGLNEPYALTTDLSRPLLFVTLHGKMQLADGWHRLYKAVVTGEPYLTAYILSEMESEAVLVLRFPPGDGLRFVQEEEEATRVSSDTASEAQAERRVA